MSEYLLLTRPADVTPLSLPLKYARFDDDNSIEIKDEDLEITAHRSSGAGGQHINKTDSAIRITHIPTGIVVGCQTERSQLQNKETAMKMLKSKLMEIKQREKLEKIEDIKGIKTNIEWGAQIRSYVFMPYTLAKDTRTGYEDGNIRLLWTVKLTDHQRIPQDERRARLISLNEKRRITLQRLVYFRGNDVNPRRNIRRVKTESATEG